MCFLHLYLFALDDDDEEGDDNEGAEHILIKLKG